MNTESTKHITVLLNETVDSLDIDRNGTYIDLTLGGGGHSKEILSRLETGRLIAFDQDQDSISRFEKDTSKYKSKITVVNCNFRNLKEEIAKLNICNVDGIIADLGLSTDQIEDETRGFSFLKKSELDMRMDKNLGVKAKDLLNALYEKELVQLFEDLADIAFAKRLAREIVNTRKIKPFEYTTDLTQIVQKIVPFYKRKGTNKRPEAKVFQALRIAVNQELDSLRSLLPQAFDLLKPQGTLSVISFHSGEDKIVKNYFKEKVVEDQATYKIKLLKTSEVEIASNPNSRSAKLRSITKK